MSYEKSDQKKIEKEQCKSCTVLCKNIKDSCRLSWL